MKSAESADKVRILTKRIVVLAAVAVAVGLLVLVSIKWGKPLWLLFRNPEQIKALVSGWGIWAPLGLVLVQIVQIVIAPLPGNVVAVVAGYVFGLGKGLLFAMIGVVLGAAITFLLSRWIGRRLLRLFLPEKTMDQFDQFAVRRGPLYVFLLLLVPNPLGDWLYYLAGLTALPLPLFLVQVLVARIPTNLLEVFIGVQVYKFGSSGYRLSSWQWALFVSVLVVLAALYLLFRKRIEAFFLKLTRFPATGS